ncbi:MAG: FeoB-associated Cys-rich membrane protein [Clostridia bacterium]|nr:FeoB-associated Cys-rich membrane protein [Clostridia bacterium]
MIINILIGVGAAAIVVGVVISTYLKRKRGETGCSCGDCSGCSGCGHKTEEKPQEEEKTCCCGCHSETPTEEN